MIETHFFFFRFWSSNNLRKNEKERRSYINQSFSKVIILTTLIIFPGLSTQVFSMFKCQKINGIDQGSLLVQDFSIYCSQNEHLIYSFLGEFLFLLFLSNLLLLINLFIRTDILLRII